MKKFKLRKFNCFLVLFIVMLYWEVIFRFFTNINIFNISFLYVLLFILGISLVLSFIINIFTNNINKFLFLLYLFLGAFIYSVQLCIYKMFSFFFDWSLIGATNQITSFASDGLVVVFENLVGIILFLLPFILFVIYNRVILINRSKWYINLFKVGGSILVFLIFGFSLYIGRNQNNLLYDLYYNTNNIDLTIRNFGVLNTFLLDTKRTVFGFNEKVNVGIDKPNNKPSTNEETKYEYNNLEIDFDKLIENENNKDIKMMHEYFKNESGTLQNKYTNFFKGKNLILFMAESFNEIAVREDLTPTLYKLVNSGFTFNNFYTPTISSTIGGEFQELTGLVAASGFLSPWKSGNNYYPLGIANVFKDMGYNTFAYHNHSYTFQSRYKYLEAIGFTNFLGCKNGMENIINCKQWPESDIEMINGTVNDYVNSDKPFFTYYVTVSGHGDYSFRQSAIARKNKELVKDLELSEKPKAYLAAQIELDKALELLINKLQENGVLDDTVIALVGDHYPYYLSNDEVNELSSYKKDEIVETNRSNFILWNNKMKNVSIDKVGSQIDVLPTIYNLFGVKFDSRIIIGKDILSTEPGLAIFGNRSWVSDKGTYFASGRKFVPKNGEVDEEYVNNMNMIVNNKMAMSKYIMVNDYYRKVLGDK